MSYKQSDNSAAMAGIGVAALRVGYAYRGSGDSSSVRIRKDGFRPDGMWVNVTRRDKGAGAKKHAAATLVRGAMSAAKRFLPAVPRSAAEFGAQVGGLGASRGVHMLANFGLPAAATYSSHELGHRKMFEDPVAAWGASIGTGLMAVPKDWLKVGRALARASVPGHRLSPGDALLSTLIPLLRRKAVAVGLGVAPGVARAMHNTAYNLEDTTGNTAIASKALPYTAGAFGNTATQFGAVGAQLSEIMPQVKRLVEAARGTTDTAGRTQNAIADAANALSVSLADAAKAQGAASTTISNEVSELRKALTGVIAGAPAVARGASQPVADELARLREALQRGGNAVYDSVRPYALPAAGAGGALWLLGQYIKGRGIAARERTKGKESDMNKQATSGSGVIAQPGLSGAGAGGIGGALGGAAVGGLLSLLPGQRKKWLRNLLLGAGVGGLGGALTGAYRQVAHNNAQVADMSRRMEEDRVAQRTPRPAQPPFVGPMNDPERDYLMAHGMTLEQVLAREAQHRKGMAVAARAPDMVRGQAVRARREEQKAINAAAYALARQREQRGARAGEAVGQIAEKTVMVPYKATQATGKAIGETLGSVPVVGTRKLEDGPSLIDRAAESVTRGLEGIAGTGK